MFEFNPISFNQNRSLQKKDQEKFFAGRGGEDRPFFRRSAVAPHTQRKCDHCEADDSPPEEVYIARRGTFFIAIPKTATSIHQLSRYLFRAANVEEDADAEVDPASPAQQIIKGLIGLNGLMGQHVYSKQQIFLGDLPAKYGFTPTMANMINSGPIFGEEHIDPESELAKMGVRTIEEFYIRQKILDSVLLMDVVSMNGAIDSIVSYGIMGGQQRYEEFVLEMLTKWAHEPLTRLPHLYPYGGQYLDKVFQGLSNHTIRLWLGEQTSAYQIILNRFAFRKDEIVSLRDTYCYVYKNDKAIKELSVWSDLAKPMVLRIPGAITEEVACFIKSVPLDIAQDAGDALEQKASDYLDTVLSDDKEGNKLAMNISCMAGGIAFDLVGGLAKVKKVIDALHDANELYKIYKEAGSLLEHLPDTLALFENEEKFLDILFGLGGDDKLDDLQGWILQPDQAPAPAAGGKQNALTKFRAVVGDLIAIIKKVLRPVFEIRRKFQQFLASAENVVAGNPVFLKVLSALVAGRKIVDEVSRHIGDDIGDKLGALLSGIKEAAENQVQGIGDKLKAAVANIKNQLSLAISDFAIAEIEKIGGTVKAAMEVAKSKVEKLISEKLVTPLLEQIGVDDILGKINTVISTLTGQAVTAVDYVVGGFTDFIKQQLKVLLVQRSVKDMPGKLLRDVMKNFFEKKNPEAKKFIPLMHQPSAVPYDLHLRYPVPPRPLDPELVSMAFEKRKQMLGTVRKSFIRNIAAAKYTVNGGSPKYMLKVNVADSDMHSEQLIGAEMQKLKDKGKNPMVLQIYTERAPCRGFCSDLVASGGYFSGVSVWYSVNYEKGRTEKLMDAYGLNKEAIMNMTKEDL